MKRKLQRHFSLTDKGIDNMMRASRASFFKYVTFMFPPMLVFIFLNDMINSTLKPIAHYIWIIVIIAILMYLATAREYKLTYDVTYEESVNLRIELAKKIKELPLSYFSTHNLSDLSQTIMMDVSNIEMAISHAVPEFIGFVVFFAIISIMMCIGNLALGLAVVMPIWMGIALMFVFKNFQTRKVKVYYMQDEVRRDVTSKIESTEKIHTAAEFTMAISATVLRVVPLLGPVLVAVIGATLYAKGSISLLYYVGYLMAVTTISHQYASLSEFIAAIFFFEDSYDRIRDLMDEEVQPGIDKEVQKFDICFNDVEFQYGDNKVINGVSFTANQNAVTAIVGPSGCGKTTVLRLLSRLYDYDKGEVTVGGEDIKSISTASLFSKRSIVFQNVELFNTSVMENIRLGRKDATDEEVFAAAKLANVDEIVAKMPDGYETQIGENGSKLSGGERQRISIARAFLKDAPIILLDEISASLDVENEMEIQNSINKLIENKTVIIVSHRMKSIEKADKIVVMDDGKVVSAGKHEELLKSSKLYGDMVRKSQLTEEYIY